MLDFEWDRAIFNDLPEPEGTAIALLHYQRSFANVVWDAAQLEGNPFTFNDVQTLMDGVTVGGHRLADEREVTGLINSTKLLHRLVTDGEFNTEPDTLRRIHGVLAAEQALDAGQFRGEGPHITDIAVALGERGTYRPAPSEPGGRNLVNAYEDALAEIEALDNPVERAVVLKCAIARGQFFYDGNKRLSRHMMNGVLMSAGHRAVSVPADMRHAYNAAMVELYADGDATSVGKLLTGILAER